VSAFDKTAASKQNKHINMTKTWFSSLQAWLVPLYLGLVFLAAVGTYGVNYGTPAAQFWDENYHIASAQKYIDGAFFMEPHPPLGKLFIALGEKIWHPNEGVKKVYFEPDIKRCKTFDQTDFVKEFPNKNEQCQDIYRLATGGECVNTEVWSARATEEEKKLTATPVPDASCQSQVKPMSFAGYRFFPVVFAILIAPLFFLVLYFFTRNPHISLAFSSLYIFENALILHSRAAMLESTQGFFIMGSLAFFAWVWGQKRLVSWLQYSILGILIGLVVVTKLNGLILIILPCFLALRDWYRLGALPAWLDQLTRATFVAFLKTIPRQLGGILLTFFIAFIVFAGIYSIHINLAHTAYSHTLNTDKNYYVNKEKVLDSSEKLSQDVICDTDHGKTSFVQCRYDKFSSQIKEGRAATLIAFPRQLMEHISFSQYYNDGVPELDVTKPGENGSSPWTWPAGNKTINYRWEIVWVPGSQYTNTSKTADLCSKNVWSDAEKSSVCLPSYETVSSVCTSSLADTIKSKVCVKEVKYLYLQGNPVVWWLSLLGVFFGLALVVSRIFFGLKVVYPRLFGAIVVLLALYGSYMVSVSQIKRVLYLYHYFIPLMMGMLLAGLVFTYICRSLLKFAETRRFVYALCVLLVCAVFATYSFFSPLTYYKPLSKEQFMERVWNRDWQLKPVE
jgi:dolichyl-phosphate-mannose-protein mannosyltransferase